MSLAAFFHEARRLLSGETDVATFQAALGESPSGVRRVAFYRVLIRRNMDKILREGCPALCARITHLRAGLWTELVDDFSDAHPATARNPNTFAAPFSDYLAQRRQSDPRIEPLWEEIADYYWLRFSAHVASDELPAGTLPDGLDHRVFVRQYSCKIPEYAQALTEDPATPPPERAPTPTLIYRHSRTLRVTAFYPTVYGLAALARRRGDDPRRLVPQLDVSQLDAVEAQLAEHGVLAAPITAM